MRNHTSSKINELEAWSVKNAAEAFEEQLRDPEVNHLLVLVDNTATLHAYCKGSAQAHLLNRGGENTRVTHVSCLICTTMCK